MKANFTAPRVKAPYTDPEESAGSTGNYGDVSLNPQGREGSDSSDQRDKLLGCRHFLNVATMNVKTILLDNKRQELVKNCESKSIAILGNGA